jgi:hypothetical protein
MKRTMILMAACMFVLAAFASFSQARAASFGMVAQDAAKEEADAYKAWFDANTKAGQTKDPKDYAAAIELAKAYVQKFPNGNQQQVNYVKKWIGSARGIIFNAARQAKNVAEEIRIGREALAEDPENIDYLYLLAIDIRTLELSANPPNLSHAADAKEFTERVIKVIESGKTPAVVPADKWNKNTQLAYLHGSLAIIEKDNKDAALEHYKQAATLEPANPQYFLSSGLILHEKYVAAAQKYQAFSAEDRTAAEPKPEVKAALDQVNAAADMVIEYWARFLGLTLKENKYGATRAQIEQVVTDLYKFRHDDKTDGLQDLINKYSSPTPPPSSNASK